MLAMALECNFGDCSEQIQIGVPYYTIEPVVKKMQARRQKDTAVTQTAKRAEWQTAYDHITVPVRAEWEAFELTLREVSSLRVGDVIEMQPTLCAETRVLLNGAPKFVGTVGLDTDRVAVQLTRKITSEETFHGKSDGRKVT
jgi:flagellar motor switch protein FliM